MTRQIWTGVLLVLFVPAGLFADPPRRGSGGSGQPEAGRPAAGQAAIGQQSIAQKRQWLRDTATQGLNNPRDIQNVRQVIDNLRPQQIDALTNAVLAQQLPVQNADPTPQQLLQQAQWELARAQAIRQQLEYLYWLQRHGRNNVAYAPVITWLPQGTNFGAAASISPDGRHVRVNPTPFFSSIGPVYSYNLNTGETYVQPQYGGYPSYPLGHPATQPGRQQIQEPTPPQQQQRPRVWYDGLRTRVGQ